MVLATLKAILQVIETYNNYHPYASLDFKTPTQCHNFGQVEKLRWYPYKKLRFSDVVKNKLKRLFRKCQAILDAYGIATTIKILLDIHFFTDDPRIINSVNNWCRSFVIIFPSNALINKVADNFPISPIG